MCSVAIYIYAQSTWNCDIILAVVCNIVKVQMTYNFNIRIYVCVGVHTHTYKLCVDTRYSLEDFLR